MDGDVRSSSDEISDSSRDENREKPLTNGTPKREQRHLSPREQINQTRWTFTALDRERIKFDFEDFKLLLNFDN